MHTQGIADISQVKSDLLDLVWMAWEPVGRTWDIRQSLGETPNCSDIFLY